MDSIFGIAFSFEQSAVGSQPLPAQLTAEYPNFLKILTFLNFGPPHPSPLPPLGGEGVLPGSFSIPSPPMGERVRVKGN
jgi:hypothetical protein